MSENGISKLQYIGELHGPVPFVVVPGLVVSGGTASEYAVVDLPDIYAAKLVKDHPGDWRVIDSLADAAKPAKRGGERAASVDGDRPLAESSASHRAGRRGEKAAQAAEASE